MSQEEDLRLLLSAESEALRCWRGGDEEGFDRLYALAAPGLTAFCRFLTGSEDTAADLFQETWQKAIVQVKADREIRSFRSWLCAIAYHLWVDQGRRRRLERQRLKELLQILPQEVSTLSAEALALREALELLPLEEREAVLLLDLQGLSFRETEEILQIPRSTLHERLLRAHEALARMLKIP